MAGRLSFRSRVQLSFLVVVAVAMLLPALYSRFVFLERGLDEARRDMAAKRVLGERLLADHLAARGPFPDQAALAAWLTEASALVDAGLALEPLGPDAQAVQAVFWDAANYPATYEPETFFSSQGKPIIVGLDNRIVRMRLMAFMPEDLAADRLGGMAYGAVSIFAVAALAALVLGFFLVRRMGRSMSEMIEVAEAIGQGHYEKRLHYFATTEFDALAGAINGMAESIEKHIATITEQKGQLEAVLDGMCEGVMVLDASGRITQVNRALARVAPDVADHIGRTPLEAFMSPELQRACDAVLELRGRRGVPMEACGPVSLQIETGAQQVYEVNIVALKTGTGLGAVVVFHDISELKRLERVRTDFVANVSHEIRTPLTSIKGYAETVLMALEPRVEAGDEALGKVSRFMEVILKNANNLARMVSDLLHLTRLENTDGEAFDKEAFDPAEAVAQALKECEHLTEGSGLRVENALADKSLSAMGDFPRVVQVFRNLLENAAKYAARSAAGPDDRAEVTVGLAQDLPQGLSGAGAPKGVRETDSVFYVADTGPGIPKDDQKRIFERFYRVDRNRAKARGGEGLSSGLGLAICKHIVERQGGRIWVQSPTRGDHGATFYFSLPGQRPSAPSSRGGARRSHSRQDPGEGDDQPAVHAGPGNATAIAATGTDLIQAPTAATASG